MVAWSSIENDYVYILVHEEFLLVLEWSSTSMYSTSAQNKNEAKKGLEDPGQFK